MAPIRPFPPRWEQCERDYSNQEDINACKVLARARVRGRFTQAVRAYEEALEEACDYLDPYKCRHTETPRYSKIYWQRCEYGIIRGVPAHNPY